MRIIGRQEWGARYGDGYGDAPLPAREVWLHHSVTVAPDLAPPFDDEHAAMRALEAIGQQRFGRGISYTFAVMPNGRTYAGHSIGRQGAHTAGRNTIARAIVLVGNYDQRPPTGPQIDGAAQLLVHGLRVGWWTAARLAGGHQQAPGASTACPGRYGLGAVAAINDRAAQILATPAAPARPRTGAAVTILEEDVPTVIAAADRPPVLVVGGLFVELRTEAELRNALAAYNADVLDDQGQPGPVWVEPGTLADLIGQSQRAVRGGT